MCGLPKLSDIGNENVSEIIIESDINVLNYFGLNETC